MFRPRKRGRQPLLAVEFCAAEQVHAYGNHPTSLPSFLHFLVGQIEPDLPRAVGESQRMKSGIQPGSWHAWILAGPLLSGQEAARQLCSEDWGRACVGLR